MEDQYFETTTLYALGRALAAERLLALDGVYPQLETLYPGLGSFLIKNQIDRALGEGFYKYDRLVLAEAVMQRDGDRLRVSTYIEFRTRYEGQREGEAEWLAPACEAIQSITPESTKLLRTDSKTSPFGYPTRQASQPRCESSTETLTDRRWSSA